MECLSSNPDLDQPKLRTPLLAALMALALAFLPPTLVVAEETSEAASRPRAIYTVHATHEEIDIDGRLDEGPWKQPATFELNYETRPAENGPAPVRTEVWIVYDVNNLYIAVSRLRPGAG